MINREFVIWINLINGYIVCTYDEGFKEGKSACCGTGQFRGVFSCGGKRIVKEFELCENPNEYLFWDSFHLTEKVYSQLAYQMWSGEDDSKPLGLYNLKDLFRDL